MLRVSFVVCFPNFLTVKIDLLYMNTENEFIGVRNRGFSSVKNLEASVSCEHEILCSDESFTSQNSSVKVFSSSQP